MRSRKEFTTLQGVVFGDLSLKVEIEFLSVNEVYKDGSSELHSSHDNNNDQQ